MLNSIGYMNRYHLNRSKLINKTFEKEILELLNLFRLLKLNKN